VADITDHTEKIIFDLERAIRGEKELPFPVIITAQDYAELMWEHRPQQPIEPDYRWSCTCEWEEAEESVAPNPWLHHLLAMATVLQIARRAVWNVH